MTIRPTIAAPIWNPRRFGVNATGDQRARQQEDAAGDGDGLRTAAAGRDVLRRFLLLFDFDRADFRALDATLLLVVAALEADDGRGVHRLAAQ